MKKVFDRNGKFYGMAIKVENSTNGLIITMPGDFPGMLERKVIFLNGIIIYEDDNRIYIEF